MKKLSNEELSQIVDQVAHVGSGISWAMEEFDLSIDEIEEIMLDANYERCPECEWFVECGELIDANMEERPCYDCQPYGDDDE